jgi:Ca-activated chloride channel family protein
MAYFSGQEKTQKFSGVRNMTKENDKLKRLFNAIPVPEPSDEAREKALKAAMTEFHRLKKADEKKFKGFFWIRRLTGKIFQGGPVMRKYFALSAGVVFSLFLAAAIILPNFTSYRKGSTSKPSYQSAPLAKYASKPKESEQVPGITAPPADKDEIRPRVKYARRLPEPAQEFGGRASAPSLSAPHKLAYRSDIAQKKMRMRPSDQTYIGRDRFETITPNPVKRVTEEPVSTFSVDVDTASYAFVRRALNSGVLPQKNAVRIEELINYFDYDYPLPKDRSVPFRPTVSVIPTPWNPDTKLLHIGIKGFDIDPVQKPRANLVFLIDVSGSMRSPDKLPLLQNAFRILVETLAPQDRVAIVVYAGAAGTVLEPTQAGEKGKILAVLDRLSAGGSTAGGEGIRQAYALAEANFDPKGVNRVILATDGDFNVGIRNPEELKGFVERKRQTGIYLTVLGFGKGNYHDALMQKLAQNGNGIAAYIDTLNEARKVLVDEAHASLFPIANDVKIQIEFNPAKVVEYRLIGYETRLLKREDFNNDRVDAGDVGSGHSVTAIYEITPTGSKGRLIEDLRYAPRETAGDTWSEAKRGEYAFLKIRYKLPGTKKSRLMTTPIGGKSEYPSVETVPGNEVQFACAVAAFGQLLRGGSYVKQFAYDNVITLAESSRGKDRFGYRSEFLNLVRLAKTARAMGEN